jgi:hypothetical protein
MTQDTITPDSINPNEAQSGEYYEDYWGVDETFKYMLPDGKQYFEIVPMNEGAKTRFQKMTNKGIRMNQRSQEATIDVDPADERHTLIHQSVISWRIMQRSADGTFSEFPCPTDDGRRRRALEQLLEKFNPKVVQDLEFFIRTKNPWMQADMDLDSLYEERERIEELIKQRKEQEAGEDSSANK